jgi:hypothetical protein
VIWEVKLGGDPHIFGNIVFDGAITVDERE